MLVQRRRHGGAAVVGYNNNRRRNTTPHAFSRSNGGTPAELGDALVLAPLHHNSPGLVADMPCY